MKTIKKLSAVFLGVIMMSCAGCQGTASQKLLPVEDSGKRAEGDSLSIAIPKGWSEEVEGDVITLTKGATNGIYVSIGGNAENITLDESKLQDAKEGLEKGGFMVDKAEMKTFTPGQALYYEASMDITQESIDEEVQAGEISSLEAKLMKQHIGDKQQAGIAYLIMDNKLVMINVNTIGDSEGMSEMMEFIADSIQKK